MGALLVGILALSGCAETAEPPEADEMAPADTVTAPADRSVAALVQQRAQLSTLAQALGAAELTETLGEAGPFTVFAPTNEAFEALPEGRLDALLEPANQEQLTELLTYHVVGDSLAAGALEDGQTLTTLSGDTLGVAITDGEVRVGGALVTQPNVSAGNGIIHVIGAVLTPPDDTP